MPSAAIIHAAVFTAGALLGGGLAVAVSSKNKHATAPYTPAPPRPDERVIAPVIGLDTYGKTSISKELSITSNLPAVLKYGNPGARIRISPLASATSRSADPHLARARHRAHRRHPRAQGVRRRVRQAAAAPGMGTCVLAVQGRS